MSARMEKAREGWGDVPYFVKALVEACDLKGSSQNMVARQLGCSSAMISQVISNKYPDTEFIERQVRMILLQSEITCPALGDIKELDCLGWRKKADRLTSSTPTVVRMFRACRNCPQFKGGK